MLIDIMAFLVCARTGGFSAAAREIGTTPSVISKRVNRLEGEIGTRLFERSTRRLTMTPEAERLRPKLQSLVAELDDTLRDAGASDGELAGSLRIRCPTTIGTMFVGRCVARFQAQHPRLATELMLIDRQVNPIEEGFDISLGALPHSFAGVEEVPFCPYPRVLVASPAYLEARGRPASPADVVRHECLAFLPVGLTWTFESASGPISVDIRARFTVNDSRILAESALSGLGLTVVPEFLVHEDLRTGRLERLMPEFPIMPLWFKAMIPRHKKDRRDVRAFVDQLREEFATPPWETLPKEAAS